MKLVQSESVTKPLLRELRQWRFTRSLETIFEEVGDGKKYGSRKKMLDEARNVLDRWLLSFQMDYSGSMDRDFPIFPEADLEPDVPVNEKLMDECMEKHFSSSQHNAERIFEEIRRRVKKFKKENRGADGSERLKVRYYEDGQADGNAQVQLDDFQSESCQRVRFLVGNFGLADSARMLMRYECLGTGSLQWGDPITVHNALYQQIGVRNEGFASPLNSKMLGKKDAHFCSLFFDTDENFGSLGSFFKVDFSKHPGNWTVNPPFIESLMEKVARKVENFVRDHEKTENVFFVTFPRWTDTPGWEILHESKYLLDQIDLYSGEFTVQCCYGRVFPPRNDLTIFVMGRKLPAPIDKIKRIFRDLDVDYIRQVWTQNCDIVMKEEKRQRRSPASEAASSEEEVEEAATEPTEKLLRPEPYQPERILTRNKRTPPAAAAASEVPAEERQEVSQVSQPAVTPALKATSSDAAAAPQPNEPSDASVDVDDDDDDKLAAAPVAAMDEDSLSELADTSVEIGDSQPGQEEEEPMADGDGPPAPETKTRKRKAADSADDDSQQQQQQQQQPADEATARPTRKSARQRKK